MTVVVKIFPRKFRAATFYVGAVIQNPTER